MRLGLARQEWMSLHTAQQIRSVLELRVKRKRLVCGDSTARTMHVTSFALDVTIREGAWKCAVAYNTGGECLTNHASMR